MSYKIGQVKKSSSTDYIQDINCATVNLKQRGYNDTMIFNEFGLKFADDSTFKTDTTYYFRFTVPRIVKDTLPSEYRNDETMNLQISLCTTDGGASGYYAIGEKHILVNNIDIVPYVANVNSQNFQYELVFTPNNGSYKYLAVMLVRGGYDHFNWSSGNYRNLSQLQYNGNDGDFATITNLLPTDIVAQKIGIQTRPGTLLAINGSSFRVGRTGVLEINCGILINSIGVAAANNNADNFILDYAYDG